MKNSIMRTLALTTLVGIAVTLGLRVSAAAPEKATAQSDYDLARHLRDSYTLYRLVDIADQKKELGTLISIRPVTNEEVLFIGGDNWTVKLVRIVTEPNDVPEAAERKIYKINHVVLGLELSGKSKPQEKKAK